MLGSSSKVIAPANIARISPKDLDSVTGALGQIKLLVRPRQAVHKALYFLLAHQAQ